MATQDLESANRYTQLPGQPGPEYSPVGIWRPFKVLAHVALFALVLVSFVSLLVPNPQRPEPSRDTVVNAHHHQRAEERPLTSASPKTLKQPSRGVSHGVSEKAFREVSGDAGAYPWTNAMLSWQKSAFHFQPEKNWMNDPDGPLFHKGWYHLFYQYNPEGAVWGKIYWGHAVSKDLVHWLHLPFAMEPDSWYDVEGVWTGSATLLPDGQIMMLYTGDTHDLTQVQNLAYPANLSDPLLLDWVKYPGNPVLVPPPGIGHKDFRDPTTAWLGPDGKWRITIGSKVNTTGVSLVYATTNFTSFELLDGFLHAVPDTGMWECIDFYPVSTIEENGLDTSANGPGIKHVLKSSFDDNRHDYYALGTYDPINNKFTPDDPALDLGTGLRLDYGKFYASKSFYDQNKKRRILWAWIPEADSERSDIMKGWASIQSFPRTLVFDNKTRTHLLQWPIDEVKSLRLNSSEFDKVAVAPGSVVPLHIGSATQLDIEATFEVDEEALPEATAGADLGYDCSTSGGAAKRGALGPFGLLVLAHETFSEQTPVYFYVARGADGRAEVHFCSDESRSSKASDVSKQVYGSRVPVHDGEKLSLRILVDHSIVESFGQGGRTVITSRIYPTEAIYGAARLFLFNNATGTGIKASVKVWHLDAAYIRPFPFDRP